MKVKLTNDENSTKEFVDIEKLDPETKSKIKKYLEKEGTALASCGGIWYCSTKQHGVISC